MANLFAYLRHALLHDVHTCGDRHVVSNMYDSDLVFPFSTFRHVFCGDDLPLKSGRPARLPLNSNCRAQRPAGPGSLFATLANIDIVSGVGNSVMGLVESEPNVIPTRRRRRRRRRRRHRRRHRLRPGVRQHRTARRKPSARDRVY